MHCNIYMKRMFEILPFREFWTTDGALSAPKKIKGFIAQSTAFKNAPRYIKLLKLPNGMRVLLSIFFEMCYSVWGWLFIV